MVLDPAKHPSPTAIAPIVFRFVPTYRFDLRKSDTKLPTDLPIQTTYVSGPKSDSNDPRFCCCLSVNRRGSSLILIVGLLILPLKKDESCTWENTFRSSDNG
ncbi:hypothetical protein L2E82_17073 [Cichorium intybus]|uniref:Uncharacterized protein n=1 Tax=Cichorium intybus TaxID=13427 RepID=A0ACB9F8L6_CICIN|nr:hypothetical protein L2E82_17073 [Cichorium intybus]